MNPKDATPYQVTQLGPPDDRNVQRNIAVTDLQSLVTHHPRANANARLVDGLPDGAENVRSRSYAVIGGEFQGVQALRTDRKYRSLQPDQVLLVKDFILDDPTAVDTRRVDVPSPLAGVIGRVDRANGVVDVHETVDGPLVARIRHLGPIAVEVGGTVAYGQALGTQNNVGLGARAGKHVHIEMDTRYYQQFEHYMLDLVEGRLPVQATHRAGVTPRVVVDDSVQRVGEAGERVAAVQRALAAGGYRNADGTTIAADGIYRLSMQGAVLQFQHDHGLTPTGDVDAPTWRTALDLSLGRPLLPPTATGEPPSRLPAAQQGLLDRIRGRLGALDPSCGPALSDGDSERVACSLLRLAVEHRLERVDHVLAAGDPRAGASGARVFIVQGDLGDPAQRRAWMRMDEAMDSPVAESVARVRLLAEAGMPMSAHHGTIEQSHGAPTARAGA